MVISSCIVVPPGGNWRVRPRPVGRVADAPPPPTSEVVDAGSNEVAEAYDRARSDLRDADDTTAVEPAPLGHERSAHLRVRLDAYEDAAEATSKITSEVQRQRASGRWRPGLRYTVAGHEVLSEDELLHRTDEMHDRAELGRAQLDNQLVAAYRREFPDASASQLDMLHDRGIPTSIRKGRYHGETCWIYGAKEAACWKANGSMIATARDAPRQPVDDEPSRRPSSSGSSSGSSSSSSSHSSSHSSSTLSWLSSSGDCRGIASGNSGLCSSSDCRGIASHNSGLCSSNECRGIASHNSGLCDSNDCRGIASGNSGLCSSSDCRGIASHNSGLCDSTRCRAVASGNSGLCD
jgi:hypothetical protein